jgi:hypothetical protein
MRSILLYAILFLAVIFQQYSCRCPHTTDEGSFYLTGEDKSVIPYSGNVTLTFKNLSGDSLIFSSHGRNSTMIELNTPDNNNDDCLKSYCEVERDEIWITSDSNPQDFLRLSLSRNKNYFTRFSIYSYMNSIPNCHVNDGCYVNAMNFYYSKDSLITPMDSIIIGSRIFYSVYKFQSENNVLYYTISQGIVGFKEVEGQDWYLK